MYPSHTTFPWRPKEEEEEEQVADTNSTHWISVSQQPFSNAFNSTNFFNEEGFFNSTSSGNKDGPCVTWQQPQHILFQLANICFCISYLAPNSRFGVLFMHGILILGFLLFSTWAWNVICAPDVFSWNFCFMILNMGQTLYILYTMRQVKFPLELEEIYQSMFQPLQVTRLVFKKLVSLDYAQIMSLHAGEAYAMQNLTRTDRLGLLISGRINVITDHHFLHHINPRGFLDSPEFESSRAGVEDKFKVSIIAATPCRYIFWQRQSLEYLLIKETYLASVLSLLLARDITTKLYAMNDKIVTEKGSHLDIRLPSITGSMTSHPTTQDGGETRSPLRSNPSKSPHFSSFTHNSLGCMQNYPINGVYRGQEEGDSVFGSPEKLATVPLANNVTIKTYPPESRMD